MMRELMTHGSPIVGTTGLAAPMSMLTICAPDNLCGAGSFYNDCPIEIQSLDSAWGARHRLVLSRPRKRARWDLVEVAASRTEEDDRTYPCDTCFASASTPQSDSV